MKRFLSFALTIILGCIITVNCSPATAEAAKDKNEVQKIIAEAQKLPLNELYKRAIKESHGKILYGIGNSSRGATAATSFLSELKAIDPSYSGKIEWSQPKSNSIFTLINADINSATHTYSMTLIQDGNQIQSKMLDTGSLLNYIPREWSKSKGTNEKDNGHPFALQTLNKVFVFNNRGKADYSNCWDFVDKGGQPLFMGVDSEPVGKNFLYMLTMDKYADYMKTAFDALPAGKRSYFKKTIDSVVADATSLGLTSKNVKYSLAWIKLWCQQYNEKTDDGPICNELVAASAAGKAGLIVYSKLRSVQESASVSVNNLTVAAYQSGYKGIGGYAYKHYLQVLRTSPLPWTSCAFIAYMTTTKEGFSAWGKDMGGYCSNPSCNQDHSKNGYVGGVNKKPSMNDRGYDWWISRDGGRLVIEDPAYCARVSLKMSDWIDAIVYGR